VFGRDDGVATWRSPDPVREVVTGEARRRCHPERPRGISCEDRVAGLASGTVGRAIPTATQNPQARWSAQRRRAQKNCNCYHRGGTPKTASPRIQNGGWERKRPETSDRADRPDAGRVGAATSRDGKGNGLVRPMRREAVPLFNGPRSTVCRGRDGIGPFQSFPPNQFNTLGSGCAVEAVRLDGCRSSPPH
jgi:hypothetical protein